jgi:integrase
MSTIAKRENAKGVTEPTKNGVTARRNAKGVITGYKAQVRIRRKGVIVHQETQTFERETIAKAWKKQREVELAKPGVLEAILDPQKDHTLGAAIADYLAEAREVGEPKRKALNVIAQSRLAGLKCSLVTASELVAYAKGLKHPDGRPLAPVTVSGYLSHLKTVFKLADEKRGFPLDIRQFERAIMQLSELEVTGTSDTRERRPTLDEISRIVERQYTRWLAAPNTIPHHLITLFAMFSARRQGEILRMRWADVDAAECRLMVYNMKDPKKKAGNNVRVDITYEALRVLLATKRGKSELVFPYAGNSISTTFKEDCQALEIDDLRFHDLRHEGTSRLFELGFDIPKVAKMTGHKTWVHLQRYTQIHEYGDKYAGWRWLDLIAPLPQIA